MPDLTLATRLPRVRWTWGPAIAGLFACEAGSRLLPGHLLSYLAESELHAGRRSTLGVHPHCGQIRPRAGVPLDLTDA